MNAIVGNPMGVYAIVNRANTRLYIGQSVHITTRIENHRTLLNARDHPNRALQADWDSYGADSFDWLLLERMPLRADLLRREHEWQIHFGERCYTNERAALPHPFHLSTRPSLTVLQRGREDRAMSVTELSRASGVSRNTIYLLERAEAQMQMRTARRLAAALNCEPADLLAAPTEPAEDTTPC
jgi:DNA-binding Xre family transcriptional regulator